MIGRMLRRTVPGLIAVVLLVAACGGSDTAVTSAATDPPAGGVSTTVAPTVATTAPPQTTPLTAPPTTAAPTTVPPTTAAPTTVAPTTVAPTPTTLAPEPFEVLGAGEYAVGVQTITVTDTDRDRALTVDIWFPMDSQTTGEPHRYTFITGDSFASRQAIDADASSISSDGPFPLVIYTHGSGGLRWIASDYTETLASHGYVVVSADHTGNTAVDQFLGTSDDGPTIAFNRPRDVQVLIDAMLSPAGAESAGFGPSIDPEQVAVTGHSLGGYATYAVASGMENEVGSIRGDDRIDALIPLAPALGDGGPNSLLSDDRLAMVDLPTLIMVGTDDVTTPVDPNVTRAWEVASSDVLYRAELVAAEHQSFTDVCDIQAAIPMMDDPTPAVVDVVDRFAVEGCSEGDMPIARVQELVNTLAVRFLDSVFAGTEMITADNTEIPDDLIYSSK